MIGFPVPGEPRRVSAEGGIQPRWRADGAELFYVSLDRRVVSVPVAYASNGLELGTPRSLFEVTLAGGENSMTHQYDVAADGRRFLVNVVRDATMPPLSVVLRWSPPPATR